MEPNLGGKAGNFLGKFTVLNGAARELWLTFLLKFVIVAAYAVTNSTIVLWLSHDLGFSDKMALFSVAMWSSVITVATLLVGAFTDAFGLRRTFFLGVWICVIARIVMALSPFKWVALAAGLFPLAVGEALGTPVLIAAVHRYSTTKQRSISFSIIYAVMNLGFLVSAYLFDWVRQSLGEYGHFKLPLLGLELTTYQMLFLASWGIELIALPALWFLREGVEATDEGLKFTPLVPSHSGGKPFGSRASQVICDSARETKEFFLRLMRQEGFHRLLIFLLLISFLKLVFMQMYYVFPKFGIRELGPGAPVGRLFAINSYFIIFLVPIIGALTQRFSAYSMVIVGGIITSFSMAIMALPVQWFASLSQGPVGHWIGHYYLGLHGEVNPYYLLIALFVITLSFGEAFYSPRVYEYAAAIAPKGQEASYGALSYIPFLMGKIFTGTISGVLLEKFCPENGVRHSWAMWLILAMIATIAPVGLALLQRFIRVREVGREE